MSQDRQEVAPQGGARQGVSRQEVTRQVAELAAVYADRRAYLADAARLKAAGYRGTIGYFCTYAPEELILAAGYHPVRIIAEPGMVGPVDGHLQSFACSFARGCLDQALRGQYEGLDGVVFPATCDSLRHAAEIWKRNVPQPFFHFLNFPSRLDAPGAAGYAAREMADLAEALGAFAGVGAAGVLAKLPEAAALTAEIRALLGRLWEARLTWTRPPVTGTEALAVFLAGVVMERREYRDRLARLMASVEALAHASANADTQPNAYTDAHSSAYPNTHTDAYADAASSVGDMSARLVVTGGVVEDPATIRLIEEAGAVVVGDDLCTGTRAFVTSGMAGEAGTAGGASGGPAAKAGTAGAPADLDGLAQLYLAKVPCPTKHPIDRRVDSLLETARRGRAAGVVFLLQKFCETHAFDQPYLTSRLTEMGLPSLVLEVEQGRLTEGQAGTRLGAFLEMIAGRREVAAANGRAAANGGESR